MKNFNYAKDCFERRKRQQQQRQHQHRNQTNQPNAILISESCFAVLPSFQRPFVYDILPSVGKKYEKLQIIISRSHVCGPSIISQLFFFCDVRERAHTPINAACHCDTVHSTSAHVLKIPDENTR